MRTAFPRENQRPFGLVPAFLIAMSLCSCASTYNSKAGAAHAALFRGDYDKAAELIDKVEPSSRDRLLHLMDRGMILHAAGRFEESNRALAEAEELSNAYEPKSISRETSATLWSEEAVNYSGDRHEKVLIPVIRMLNYILLDQWDEALVEVRRIENVSERVYGKSGGPPNAFATYLSAVVWEAMGHIGDALIDYRRTGKLDKDLPYYGLDLKYSASRSGLASALPSSESGAWKASENYRRQKGEIVVIVEAGRSPEYVSESVTTGLVSVQLPTVVAWPGGARDAKVFIDGVEAGSTHSFYGIGGDILEALAERQKRSFVRKAVKSALQTGLYVAGAELAKEDEVEAQIAGIALIFLGISMSAAEKADERSWRSLPSDFGVGRFFVKPGKHDVRIVAEGGEVVTELSVDVPSGQPRAILARLYGSGLRREKIERAEPRETAEARKRAAKIEGELAAAPGDGRLLINLAYARMESGDFAVDGLLTRGMKAGGDKYRATQGLVISNAVRGDLGAARSWAEKGGHAKYARCLSIAGMGKGKENSGLAPVKEKGLVPAFDWFLAGLVREKKREYGKASSDFAAAYRLGLRGEEVEKKVMQSFRKADESFKGSEEGRAVMEEFAEGLIQ